MPYFWYIFFGLAPSIIWLLLFLLNDKYPEPKKMILKVFFYGMLAAIIVVFLVALPYELIAAKIAESSLVESPEAFLVLVSVIASIIIAPVSEELAKYLVVRLKIIAHSEFDEPVDAIIYMIVAALGFSATENLLYLSEYLLDQAVTDPYPLTFAITRFTGATILHALCSGLVGYYIAMSFFNLKNRAKLILKGLLIAMALHGLFNFFMLRIQESIRLEQFSFAFFTAYIVLLVVMAVFLSQGFKKVKKLKSVCKI